MNKTVRILGTIVFSLVLLFLIWRFAYLIFYLIISVVLSLMGRPLVNFFNSIRIGKKFHIPNIVSTILTMCIIIGVFGALIWLLLPLVTTQAAIISNINFTELGHSFDSTFAEIEPWLREYRLLGENESIKSEIQQQINSFINLTSVGQLISYLVGATGSLMLAIFSILFFTFFFLKDADLVYYIIESITPESWEEEIKRVVENTGRLLTRYFIGLFVEVISMIILITTGLTILGVENALLIGFLGGLLNIIPYLGPIIGATLGSIIAAAGVLSVGDYTNILPVIFKVIGAFSFANLIDNIVLQPVIYSTSVKAHPIEIYIVILVAGSLIGVAGMILAVPAYTVIRIIAKEFFSHYRFVERLTRNI